MRREWRERHVEDREIVDSRSVNVSIVTQHVSSMVVDSIRSREGEATVGQYYTYLYHFRTQKTKHSTTKQVVDSCNNNFLSLEKLDWIFGATLVTDSYGVKVGETKG